VSSAVARGRAWALGDGRTAVPEPDVKAALREFGVPVPRHAVGATPAAVVAAAVSLDAPLVLKAYGPGLLHKSDAGAVVTGLTHADLVLAVDALGAHLRNSAITPAGYLVEEQHDTRTGVELVAGVVRREPFGLVVALGLGGTLAEALDLVALRMFPLREHDAAALMDEFPGAPALAGFRGGPPLDRDALARALLAIAGTEGLAARLGDELDELECNPMLASERGVVALDARLVLREAHPASDLPPPTDFTRLFAPRAVSVAGASTTRSTFGNRALAAYRAAGWDHGLYALHPEAAEIDGVPAQPAVGEIDEPVDYLLVAVPAARCAEVIRETAGRVPFVQVVSGGFDEVGRDGAALSRSLIDAARDVKTRVVGPNCIGVYSATGRQTFQLNSSHAPGSVSVVSQSGGLAGDLVMAGTRRGIRYSKVLSVGNAVDVTPAEVVEWLLDDPETSVIGLYLEGAQHAGALVDVLHRARGRTPVVLLVGGRSDAGARAVASHTGALAGEPRVWRAIATSTGIALVDTLEQLLGVLAYLQRWAAVQPDPGADAYAGAGDVLVVGVGGGASVLATDACERAGLTIVPTTAAVRATLRSKGLGAGTSVENPLEIPFGPAAAVDALRAVVGPVLDAQPYADVLVHVNTSAYYSYGTEGIGPLIDQLTDFARAPLGSTRLAVVLRNLDVVPAADAEALLAATAALGVVTFRSLDEGATAIAALARFADARADRSRATQ
jgi:acyl-CoA synthetase (NDP forming)